MTQEQQHKQLYEYIQKKLKEENWEYVEVEQKYGFTDVVYLTFYNGIFRDTNVVFPLEVKYTGHPIMNSVSVDILLSNIDWHTKFGGFSYAYNI